MTEDMFIKIGIQIDDSEAEKAFKELSDSAGAQIKDIIDAGKRIEETMNSISDENLSELVSEMENFYDLTKLIAEQKGALDKLSESIVEALDAGDSNKVKELTREQLKGNLQLQEMNALLEKSGIRLDELGAGLDGTTPKFQQYSNAIEKTDMTLKNVLSKFASITGVSLGIAGLKSFIGKVYEVRSSFQDIESSMEVFLGSQEKAASFTKELKDYAWYNMFEFTDLADASKQLIAYGNSTETIIPVIDKLSNIATATKQPLMDLVNLYNKAKNIGSVDADGLASWAAKGVVLKDVLKEMGQEVNSNKISFEQLDAALTHVTSSGGMFAGIMDKMMPNLSSSWGQLQDDIANMFNEIGEKTEGLMKKGIETASNLVSNYETLGKVLAVLVGIYGTYKTVMLVLAAVEKVRAARLILLKAETEKLTKAQILLNKTIAKSPYILAATAVISLGVAIYKLTTQMSAAEKATQAVAAASIDAQGEYAKEVTELDILKGRLENAEKGSKAWNDARDEIVAKFGKYNSTLGEEIDAVGNLTTSYDSLTASIKESVAARQIANTVEAQTEFLQGTTDEGLEKIKKALQKQVDKDKKKKGTTYLNGKEKEVLEGAEAGKILSAITSYVYGEGELSEDIKKEIVDLDKGLSIYDWAKEAKESQESLKTIKEDATNQINNILGLNDVGAEVPVSVLKSQNEALQKELDGLEEGSKRYTEIREKIFDNNSKIQKAEGNSDGKNNTTTTYNNTNIDNKTLETLKKAQERYLENVEKFGAERAEAMRQLEAEAERATIEAMEDGAEKEQKLRDYEHKQNLAVIQKEYDDQLAEIEKNEKELYEAQHGSTEGYEFNVEGNDSVVEASKQKSLAIANENKRYNTEQLKAKKEAQQQLQADRLEYLQQYGSYKEKELAITESYDKQIEEAESEFQKKILEKEKDNALYELQKSYSAAYALIFASASDLSNNQLLKAIEYTQAEIKKAEKEGDVQKLTELYERLNEQLSEQSSRKDWGFSKISRGFQDLAKASAEYEKSLDEGLTQEERTQALQNSIRLQSEGVATITEGAQQISDAFSDLGSVLEDFDGALGQIGGLLSGLASQTDSIVTMFTSDNKGEIISSAIGSATSLISMIGSQIKENKETQEEWNQTIKDCAHEYAMLQLEALEYEQSNIFGVENPYKKAIAGAHRYAESMKLLKDTAADLEDGQVQTGTKKKTSWGNVGKGAAAGAAIGGAVGNWIGAAIGAVVGGISGLLTKETVAVFSDLSSQYEYLYDDETYELNPQIIADYEKLDDETKQIVDNWNDIRDTAMEAQEDMKDTFSNLAGDIGNNLSDALVEAFRNGDLYAAVDDFHDSVTDTIEDIIEQMIFSTMFEDLFTELQDRMMDSFGENGDNDITDDIIWFDQAYQERLAAYEQAMKDAQASMEELGYETWQDDSERSSSTKGIAQASQDTVDELNGRFTAIQSHTFWINGNVATIVGQNEQMLALMASKAGVADADTSTNINELLSSYKDSFRTLTQNSASILEQVCGIHNDTTLMQSDIYSLKLAVQDIKDKGVKLLG